MTAHTALVAQRELGSGGLRVSAQALGTLSINEFYGTSAPTGAEVSEGLATIHHAVDRGVTYFDTADIYGNGANEELLGRELHAVRDRVVIASKFGGIRVPGATSHEFRGDPEYVRQSCEGSLRRLRTDYLDIYYQHRADDRVPIEDTVGAMSELVAEGKVRYIGLSEPAVDTIERAHRTHPVSVVQSEYSLYSRDVEAEVIPACRRLGIGFVAYSPLGRGLLTGTITPDSTFADTDWRRSTHPRFSDENLRANQPVIDRIAEIAARHGVTTAQVALAWLHSRGDDVVPVVGTKRRKYLDQNLAALGVRLDTAELSVLDSLSVQGTRYPDMSSVYRRTPPKDTLGEGPAAPSDQRASGER